MRKDLFLGTIFTLILWSSVTHAADKHAFVDVLKQLESHDAVLGIESFVTAQKELAKSQGSWGDPQLSITAMNMPKDDYSLDKSPMSGLELRLSQKFPLTKKYRYLKESAMDRSRATQARAGFQKIKLAQNLWSLAILRQQTLANLEVNNESLDWIEKMLRVSKKMYANGGLSQQALLDIQMRKGQLSSLILDNRMKLKEIEEQLSYYTKDQKSVDLNHIPWDRIEKAENVLEKNIVELNELSLKNQLSAAQGQLQASSWARIPDVSLGIGYIKREANAFGDAVSVSLSMPLPISSNTHALKEKALKERRQSLLELNDYIKRRDSTISSLVVQKKSLEGQLKILKSEILKFAQSSREIAAKSYENGSLSYSDLLDSELKYQSFQTQVNNQTAKLRETSLELLVLQGDDLMISKE